MASMDSSRVMKRRKNSTFSERAINEFRIDFNKINCKMLNKQNPILYSII